MHDATSTLIRARQHALGAALIALATTCAWSQSANARDADLPYLDNETIGTFHVIEQALQGPAEQFDGTHWAPDLLDKMASGDAMGPLRYVIAFSAYAVAQTATHTPAYRRPYQAAMTALIHKMLHHRAWDDWLKMWGDNPLGPDNIMFTGHLVYMMTLHRQVFGDDTFEQPVKLINPAGPEFETDLVTLAASVAKQGEDDVNNEGDHTYNIACEPGRIFVPCNEPHRLAFISLDRIYATQYAGSNAAWLKWTRDHMLHPKHLVLRDLYYPFGKGEAVKGSKPSQPLDRVSGVYNGWMIWMLAALDEPWAGELYQRYKAYFVVRGEDSPAADGRTTVLDRTGATGLAGDALNLIATGFGLVAARQFDDAALFEELDASWSASFGEPAWSEDGRLFQRTFPVIPLMFQNGFPLLALSTTKAANVKVLADQEWRPERFEEPFLDRVVGGFAFVNQAAYDPERRRLVLTINGGSATQTSVALHVANFRRGDRHVVHRDGVVYKGWSWQEDDLVIQTPALSADEATYTVQWQPPLIDDGCSAGTKQRDPLPEAILLLLLVATLGRMRRQAKPSPSLG